MVPARSRLSSLHHDGGKSSSSSYCPQYCATPTQQLDAAAASAAGATRQLPRPRFPGRRLAMAADNDDAAGTSSRGGRDDKDWLQLGLATAASASSSGDDNNTQNARTTMMPPPQPFPLPIIRSYQYGHGRCRPTAAAASGSMPSEPSFLPFARPLRSYSGDPAATMRVISPPRRTEASGLWLTLEAAPNQVREPILPQIQKSYLRIKDSNVKVEVVMKYLAGKLGLTQTHQVELTCRGQLLPPFLLVKYVRDSIWCSSPAPSWEAEEEEDLVDLTRDSPAATTDHVVMTLSYRTSRSNYH